MKIQASFIVFLASALFLVALVAGAVGFAIAYTKAPPTAQVGRALQRGKTFLETGVAAPENLLLARLPGAPAETFHMHREGAPRGSAAPSTIYNLERDIYVIDPHDADGTKVWTWPAGDPAIEGSGGEAGRIHPHGLIVQADGSILINGVGEREDPGQL